MFSSEMEFHTCERKPFPAPVSINFVPFKDLNVKSRITSENTFNYNSILVMDVDLMYIIMRVYITVPYF